MDRKLILFVEDDEHDRELYGKLLWYNGFDVQFAMTGGEGMRFLETEHPRLVVLDLQLPDVSGVEVCQRMRASERTSDVPVVILTGRPKREFAAWAEAMGCAGFLEKPVTPLEVLYEVERVIGRAPLPGDIVAAERQQGGPAGGALPSAAPVPDVPAAGLQRNPFERMVGDHTSDALPRAAHTEELPKRREPEAEREDPRRDPSSSTETPHTEPPRT
jgi:CheY-like chemotaxis protein